MKTERKPAMYERIRQHGEELKAAFGLPADTDPVKLCKALRRIELRAHQRAEDLCNGMMEDCEEMDAEDDKDIRAVERLLGDACMVFVNRDPRGYALKIPADIMDAAHWVFHRDWGGYGILAPDLTDND